MLTHRLITAIIGIPLLIYLIYVGALPLFLAVSLVFLLGLNEFINMLQKAGYSPLKLSMYIGGLLLIGEAYLYGGKYSTLAFFMVFILLAINLILVSKLNVATMAVSFLGVIYLSFFKYILLLRDLPDGFLEGFYLILIAFILTWMVDTGAYFSGRLFGNKKLAPNISPNKTWEGAIGGTVFTILAAVILHFTLMPLGGMLNAMILGLLIAIAGQLGDLLESLIKRSANVKDSGNLLPGHGGILDRFDSILFTMPVTYYFMYFMNIF